MTSLGSVCARTYDGEGVKVVKGIFEKGMDLKTDMGQELKEEKM